MIVHNVFRRFGIYLLVDDNFNDIVNHDEAANYETLSYLESVNPSVDIDSIGTENSDVSHIEVVEES
jgi:hypothetical protein